MTMLEPKRFRWGCMATLIIAPVVSVAFWYGVYHLAPKKDKRYKGRIIYAIGCFGDDPLNPTVLSCKLRGLDSSPWFFDADIELFGLGHFWACHVS